MSRRGPSFFGGVGEGETRNSGHGRTRSHRSHSFPIFFRKIVDVECLPLQAASKVSNVPGAGVVAFLRRGEKPEKYRG